MTDEVATSREWAGDVRCRALILPASAIRSPNSARRSLFCERRRAQSTHSAGRCDPRTYKVVMGDTHEIRLLLYRGVQEPTHAVLPALKPSGYCTTIICPCPREAQRLFRIMQIGARLVRRARPSMNGGSPPRSENRVNSCPSPIAIPGGQRAANSRLVVHRKDVQVGCGQHRGIPLHEERSYT